MVHQTAEPIIYQYIVQHYLEVSLMKLCRSSVVVHQTVEPIIYQYIVQHYLEVSKVSKGAKIRNRYNQLPHLTQDINGKVTNSQ